jgi:methionyl-tRNA formyltransferase
MKPTRRIAFFGSPAWAVPVLEALNRHHQVVLVVTQPDKPAGRGLQLRACPVAQLARSQGLELQQPKKLRGNAEFLQSSRSLELDVAVTAAYGKILPADLLQVPQFGFLNLHPSDLPKYRGPAPVQWTLINGDTETAVCIMQTDAGMDTGPIVAKWHSPVDPDETAVELSSRLRDKGIELLLEALENLEALAPRPQPTEGSHAPMLEKDHGKIDWSRRALEIYNRHRGVQPWPGSWCVHQGKRLKVLKMRLAEGLGAAGQIVALGLVVGVGTGDGVVELLEVQPENKKPMPAGDWARGYGLKAGEVLD